MANSGPILYNVFDATRLTFDKLSKNKRGSKSVKIGYAGHSNVLIQTPVLYLPMGLSVFSEEDGARENVSLPCSLNCEDPKVAQFVRVIKDIEEMVAAHCANNSSELFGRSLSPESISTIYTSPIKEGRAKPDGDAWPPLLRVKVSSMSQTAPRVFDLSREEIAWDTTPSSYKRYSVRLLLQLQPIWFVGKGFGISFRVQQMSIVNVPPQQDRNMFLEDDSLATIAEDIDSDDA
jgi:hypothetical protein